MLSVGLRPTKALTESTEYPVRCVVECQKNDCAQHTALKNRLNKGELSNAKIECLILTIIPIKRDTLSLKNGAY